MYLEIVSPEAILFSGEVDSVVVPGTSGDFQMLNNHAPVVSTLKGGTVRINGAITIEYAVKDKFTQDGADVNLFSITSGTVEMRNNKLILLAD